MNMATVNLERQTLESVRSALSRDGGEVTDVAVSEFIDRAARRAAAFHVIETIQQRNADVDPVQLQKDVDDAVAEVRAERRSAERGDSAP